MVRLYVNSVAKHTVIIIYFIHCKLYFISRSRKNVYAAPDSTKIFNVALRRKSLRTPGIDVDSKCLMSERVIAVCT